MLPKVATHLLHTTTRSAAAAVHNQTSTLRNVLQGSASGPTGAGGPSKPKGTPSAGAKPVTIALVSASGSSLAASYQYASNSGANGNANTGSDGPNAGPNGQSTGSGPRAKNGSNNPKAGRRYYTNYNSASRAVTQANTIIVTEDVPGFQSFTSDEINFSSSTQESRRALLKASSSKGNVGAQQKRSRLRSSSVNTLLPRNEKEKDGGVMEKMSVLKTVQLQARSLHVLSAAATKATAAANSAVPFLPTQQQAPQEEQSSTAELASHNIEEVVVEVEVVAPTPLHAASLASPAATARPQSPSLTSPRATSPLALRRRNSTSSIRSLSRPSSPLLFTEEPAEVHVHLARRNSTVSSLPTDSSVLADPSSPALSTSESVSDSGSASISEATSATSATRSPKVNPITWKSINKTPRTHWTKYSYAIKSAQNEISTVQAVRQLIYASENTALRTTPPDLVRPLTGDFNTAIAALMEYRREGETLAPILEVYTALLEQGARESNLEGISPSDVVKPNVKTYTLLIDIFTKRDWECQRIMIALSNRIRGHDTNEAFVVVTPDTDAKRIGWLKKESQGHFSNAFKLFEALLEIGGRTFLEDKTYKALLKSSASHGNAKAALVVFGQLERKLENKAAYDQAKNEGASTRKAFPDIDAFKSLLQAFTNHGDFEGAEVIFQNFKQSWEAGNVHVNPTSNVLSMQVQVWNQMLEMYFRKGEPEKAVDMLDAMLKASSTPASAPASAETDELVLPPVIPTPASSTFTTIIGGFIKMGDVPTAYMWFNRLLQEKDTPALNPFKGATPGRAMKPDQVAWTLMLDALATEGMIAELNQSFQILVKGTRKRPAPPAEEGEEASDEPMSLQGVRVFKTYRHIVINANLRWVSTHGAQDRVLALQRLDFLKNEVFPIFKRFKQTGPAFTEELLVIERLVAGYTHHGAFAQGLDVIEAFVAALKPSLAANPSLLTPLQNLGLGFWGACLEVLSDQANACRGVWDWTTANRLARLNTEELGLKVTPHQAIWLVHSFGQAIRSGELATVPVSLETFRLLLGCSVHVDAALAQAPDLLQESGIQDFASLGTGQLLQEMSRRGVLFEDTVADPFTRLAAVELTARGLDADQSRAFFTSLGPTYLQAWEQQSESRYQAFKEQLEDAVPEAVAQPQEQIDIVAPPQKPLEQHSSLSRDIDLVLKSTTLSAEERVAQAYALFSQSYEEKNMVPHIPTITRLIQVAGRLSQLDKVQEIYTVANMILSTTDHRMGDAKRKSMWAMIEDSMIIALAHAGDIEGAHVHRTRILEHPTIGPKVTLAPSADAYGALILYVKDTTDDASNALMLWNEAMRLGVTPNLYLYNNIISKLSRARKADYALELFHTMREQRILPSSITYGAVIGACARVGDVISAETLFKEMSEQTNFKPRVPPFNTMMQVYTTTKPNRERVLWYYEEMIKMGIKPTAHTYKLLLDAYGSVEPVDIASMERTFEQLKQDRYVQIQGTHIASLINAYGCVMRDLERAMSIFENIPTHIVNGKPLVPDAVVYEAIVNVIVANKQTSLIPGIMERMAKDQVHMTAYVANFLIKGYANVGDIEQARGIFEGMSDPPTGVAAPNNHLPHDPAVSSEAVGLMEPVYREPSTWEAMIRAELGVGNRTRAHELLDRLRARHYPEAVFNRISGVLVDHSAVVIP